MNRWFPRLTMRFTACLALIVGITLSWATIAAAQQPAAAARQVAPPAGFRKLAPGVETTVPLPIDPHDTVAYHSIVELLAPPAWCPSSIGLRRRSPNRRL